MHGQDSTFRRSLCACAVLATAMAPQQVLALDPSGRTEGPPSVPRPGEPVEILVRTVHADAVAGRLLSFSLAKGLILERDVTGKRRHIPTEDIVHLSTMSGLSKPAAGMDTVTLSGADRVIGKVVGFTDDRVVMETPLLGIVRIPLERIATWMSPLASNASWHSNVKSMLSKPSSGSDSLLLTNGDRIDGIITALDAAGFAIETPAGSSTLAIDRVVAASILSAPPADAKGLRAQIRLIDSGRITTDRITWAPSSLAATLFDDREHHIPTKNIACVNVIGGRWQWLSDLTPISVEQTSMLSLHWPFFRNRNVLGGPLYVDRRSFEHGLGVHSRSVLTFELVGGYSQFVTSYGIDDDSGPLADTSISIRVDGSLRHKRDSVRPGTLFGPVRVNINHAKRLELIVDFGSLGSIQDRFNWIEPALIR